MSAKGKVRKNKRKRYFVKKKRHRRNVRTFAPSGEKYLKYLARGKEITMETSYLYDICDYKYQDECNDCDCCYDSITVQSEKEKTVILFLYRNDRARCWTIDAATRGRILSNQLKVSNVS